MTTGERIQKARKAAKLSQKELGERLGVSASMIGQYENNLRNPKTETLLRIAEALNVDLKELWDGIFFFDDFYFEAERKNTLSSIAFEKWLSLAGYDFYIDYHNADEKTILCVDNNNKKLYLLPSEAPATLEHTVYGYLNFQIAELLKTGREIEDSAEWFTSNK